MKTLVQFDPKITGPTPPTPPLITLRPGRRLVVVARVGRAAVELRWPARAGGTLEIVTRGKGVWVNRHLTGKITGPTPPTPPLTDVVNVVQAAGVSVELRGSEGSLQVDVARAKVLVNGEPLPRRRPAPRVPPGPPRDQMVPPRGATTARSAIGPDPNNPPA